MTVEYVVGCTGKRKYSSEALAMEVHARVVEKRGRKTQQMYPYKCAHCGCWHVSAMSPEAFAARGRQIAEYRGGFARGARR